MLFLFSLRLPYVSCFSHADKCLHISSEFSVLYADLLSSKTSLLLVSVKVPHLLKKV